MLCGGVTVYSPLKNNGCGPGKKVGIIGVGGLGHFGILFAKALGADKVVGISRHNNKRSHKKKWTHTPPDLTHCSLLEKVKIHLEMSATSVFQLNTLHQERL